MRIVLVICVLMVGSPANAQGQRITLTPSVVELKGIAGQSTVQKLTVRNDTSQELTFEMHAQDVLNEGATRVFLSAGDLPHGIAASAAFSPERITVLPGQSGSVHLMVTVPHEPSNRAIVALFRGTTILAKRYNRSTLSLGALITFTLSDHHSLAADDLLVRPQSEAENAGFELLLINDGAEPQMPKGAAVVLSKAGTMVGRVSFDSRRLLPGERATFKTTYPGELPPGTYRVVSTFEYSGRSLTRTAELVVP